ncbi:MAG: hypothetical protein HOV79_01175, partial [Hamadaea sp.]|nr:hypothetical protein [Hamadaea sp.]
MRVARSWLTRAALSLLAIALVGAPAPTAAVAAPSTQASAATTTTPPAADVLDLLSGLPVDAQQFGAQDEATGTQPPSGVAPEVRAALQNGGTADVIIRLRAQPDLSALTRRAADEATAAAEDTRRRLTVASAYLSRQAVDRQVA